MTAHQKTFLKDQEIRDGETALATAYQKYKLSSINQAEWERGKDKEYVFLSYRKRIQTHI